MLRTEDFQKAVVDHVNYWRQLSRTTTAANKKEVESCLEEFYRKTLKRQPPQCVWANSWLEAKRANDKLPSDYDTAKIINDKLNDATARAETYLPASSLRTLPGLAIETLGDPLFMGRHTRFFSWPDHGLHSNLQEAAYNDFFIRKLGLFKALQPWQTVLVSCSRIYFNKDAVVLADTPALLHADDNDRLHCDDGPALRFRNGSEYYFLHGVLVPKDYVLTQPVDISLKQVLEERNAQVRMALLNKIGFTRLLGTARHWTISEANGNRLIEFRVKGTQFLRCLHLRWRDKVGEKETVIPVPSRRSYFGNDCPADIDDCEQVRRWTLGWPKEALAIAET
jgi:hypothetical protein